MKSDSDRDKAMAKRVRLAIGQAAYGSSLFPTWKWHVSSSRRALTIRYPRASIAARWVWDEGEWTDEKICFGIDMLVDQYLHELRENHSIDLTPAEA